MQSVDRKIFLVSIKALVLDRGRVLLVQKPNGIWDLPGGRLEDGEAPADCFVRELYEETGIRAAPGGVATSWLRRRGPQKLDVFVVAYWCDAAVVSDEVRLSDEHVASGLFVADELAGLEMEHPCREALTAALTAGS